MKSSDIPSSLSISDNIFLIPLRSALAFSTRRSNCVICDKVTFVWAFRDMRWVSSR